MEDKKEEIGKQESSSSDHELPAGSKTTVDQQRDCQPSTSRGKDRKLRKKKNDRREPSGENSTEEEASGKGERHIKKKKKKGKLKSTPKENNKL